MSAPRQGATSRPVRWGSCAFGPKPDFHGDAEAVDRHPDFDRAGSRLEFRLTHFAIRPRDCDSAAFHGVLHRFFVAFALALGWIVYLCAPARAASPGGVAGDTLWFAASGYNGTTWTDQSGSGAILSQPAAASGYSSPTALSLDANFNPGVGFNGSSQELRGAMSTAMFANANSYMFGVSNSSVLNPTGANTGDVLSGYTGNGNAAQGIIYTQSNYGFDTGGNFGAGPFTQPTATSILSDIYYSTAGNGANASASENGLTATHSLGNSVFSASLFEIGGRTTGGWPARLWTGAIDEVIYYNNLSSPLTTAQMTQIRSYLAIKYGITLGFNTQTQAVTGTNYLSSAGTTIWSGASNATYAYDVAGIGQDASSALDQRVSHSINSSTYGNALDVTVANGTSLSTTSQTANSAFVSDASFVIWGDNGGSTTMSTVSGTLRMSRIWRTQVTGSGSTHVTVQVPKSAFSGVAVPVIWVASDAAISVSVSGTTLSCGATYCTATIPTFSSASTQYFTFGGFTPAVTIALAAAPNGVQPPGTVLTYTGIFTNGGTAAASSLAIIDPIPANTDFQVGSAAASLGSSGLTVSIVYSNDSGSTWTYTPVSGGGGASSGYDRAVTNVKFMCSGSLSYTNPNNTASFSLAVKIR